MPELIEAIQTGSHHSNICGVIMPLHETESDVRPCLSDELDSVNLPNRDIFDPIKYLQKGISLNIRSKRGCPFKCIYCTTPQIEGSKMRLRTPRLVVDELEILNKAYGAAEFYITDNIFNYPLRMPNRSAAKFFLVDWTSGGTVLPIPVHSQRTSYSL